MKHVEKGFTVLSGAVATKTLLFVTIATKNERGQTTVKCEIHVFSMTSEISFSIKLTVRFSLEQCYCPF